MVSFTTFLTVQMLFKNILFTDVSLTRIHIKKIYLTNNPAFLLMKEMVRQTLKIRKQLRSAANNRISIKLKYLPCPDIHFLCLLVGDYYATFHLYFRPDLSDGFISVLTLHSTQDQQGSHPQQFIEILNKLLISD